MTDLISISGLAASVMTAFAVTALALFAFFGIRRSNERAARAERRLSALYAEVEGAIGARIDRSIGGPWRDQVSLALKQLPKMHERGSQATDWVAVGASALEAAQQALGAMPPDGEAAMVARALRLAERIEETRKALGAIDKPTDLEGLLVSGTLNDLLTTAPLLEGYFGHVLTLAPLTEAYVTAAASIKLELALHGILVEMPPVLSTISGSEARADSFDVRELRRILPARNLAYRAAERLAPGESLVVYCNVPGWRTKDERRPPSLVVWSQASWLT